MDSESETKINNIVEAFANMQWRDDATVRKLIRACRDNAEGLTEAQIAIVANRVPPQRWGTRRGDW